MRNPEACIQRLAFTFWISHLIPLVPLAFRVNRCPYSLVTTPLIHIHFLSPLQVFCTGHHVLQYSHQK